MELFWGIVIVVAVGLGALIGLSNGFSFKRKPKRKTCEDKAMDLLERMTEAEEKENER